MTTRETPEQILTAADDDIRTADERLVALEDRVRDGDTDVQPEEIEKARGLRHLAQLRREAAEKRAARLRQEQLDAQLQERANAFRASVEGLSLADIARLHRAAEDALDALATACERRDKAIVDGSVQLAAAGESQLPIHAVPYSGVRIGEESWGPEPAGPLIGRLVREVAQRHDGLPVARQGSLVNALSRYHSAPGEVERLSAELRETGGE